MKITNIKCDQFAGIRQKEVALKDGINIVYGPNESGKSTLASLISSTLFQKVNIGKKYADDKKFVSQFYPSSLKSGKSGGDYIDGSVTFETENGTFTVSKEWGNNPICKLSTPEVNIKDPEEIYRTIREELIYGEGVYREILLASQKNMKDSFKDILDDKNNATRIEIGTVMAQALANVGSVSLGDIGPKIDQKIVEIMGSHWDDVQNIPMRKTPKGRWTNGVGSIHKAYHEVEDAQNRLEDIKSKEDKLSSAERDYREAEALVNKAKENHVNFSKFASLIKNISFQQKELERSKVDGIAYKNAISMWPELERNLEKAEKLHEESQNRKTVDDYESLKKIQDDMETIKKNTNENIAPDEAVLKLTKKLDQEISKLLQKLSGLNLLAQIKLLGDYAISAKTLSTGESIVITDGEFRISEAVILTIPNVMEMQLSPANIDTEAVQVSIKAKSVELEDIFSKYGVVSIENLEDAVNTSKESKRQLDSFKQKFDDLLGLKTWEEVEIEGKSVTCTLRTKKEIEDEIVALCGRKELNVYKALVESDLHKIVADYISFADLKELAEKNTETFAELESSLSSQDDIPEAFKEVRDADGYLKKLEDLKEDKVEEMNKCRDLKAAASNSLQEAIASFEGDSEEALNKAQHVFESAKMTLKHWMHIKEVYEELKDSIKANPLEDMANSFQKYLNSITDGNIESEFTDNERLNVNIYSGPYQVDFDKLSEGTKDTVSLAFRLAVIEHLFPDGGAFVVFDDPFTDMDPIRTKQGCDLVNSFGINNQVIFMTCDDKYKEMLDGHIIEI